MAVMFNNMRVLGVVAVDASRTIFNNQPVIGVRAAADGILFDGMHRVLGVQQQDAGTKIWNDQPVIGVVLIADGRVMFNNQPVIPVSGLSGGDVAPWIIGTYAVIEVGQTVTIFRAIRDGAPATDETLTLNGVDMMPFVTASGNTYQLVTPSAGDLVYTGNGATATATVRPLLKDVAGVTLQIDTATPFVGTAADVTQINAGGSRALQLAQMESGNAVKVTKTATGFRFSGGNWLRRNAAPATAVGKVFLLARFFAYSHTGTDGRFIDTTAADLWFLPSMLRGSGVLGVNFNINYSGPSLYGSEMVIGLLVDYDAGVVTRWEFDGNQVATTYTPAAGTQGLFDLGRYSNAELRELIMIETAPGQPLPIAGYTAWAQMARAVYLQPTRAEVMGGLGQSLWQSWPVSIGPDRDSRNFEARAHTLSVDGIRRLSDGALINAIGNGMNMLDYSITPEQVTISPVTANNGETVLFATARALRDARASEGLPTPAIIVGTNGLGGQGIEEFDDDPLTGQSGNTILWTNNRYWFDTAHGRGLMDFGQCDIRYFGVVHGTAHKTDARGVYRDKAIRVIDLHLDHCSGLSGRRPKVWMTQSGGDANTANDGATPWDVVMDQIDLVRHYDAIFFGPLYPYKIGPESPINVHPDHENRRAIGELGAIKMVAHERGLNMNAMPGVDTWAADRRSVTLSHTAPHGCTALGAYDTAKYDAYGGGCDHFGFTSDVEISSVNFSGRDIIVGFSSPAGILHYSRQRQDMQSYSDINNQGYTGHRGLIAWDWSRPSLKVPGHTHRLWLPSYSWVSPS